MKTKSRSAGHNYGYFISIALFLSVFFPCIHESYSLVTGLILISVTIGLLNFRYACDEKFALKWSPSRIWSKLSGIVADTYIPKLLRRPIYYLWGRYYKINFDEFLGKFEDYPNLNAFFTRQIKPRIIDPNPKSIVSPNDGLLTHAVELIKDDNFDVKGILYKAGELFTGIRGFELNAETMAKLKYHKENKLYLVGTFLDSGNYHHYFSPVDFVCKTRNHIAGHIRTVNPSFWFEKQNIYEENERVALYGEWKHGFFGIVFIAAAWRVGAMNLLFDKDLNTRKIKIEPEHYFDIKEYPNGKPEFKKSDAIKELFHKRDGEGIKIKKGDEIGNFLYGSSIGFLIEASTDFKFVKQQGDPIFYGQPIAIDPQD